MKKYILLFFITFYLSSQIFVVSAPVLDSLRTVVEKGKKYILHEVEAGQTLFALSRIYGVEVQSIKDANIDNVTSLNVGQKILVPIAKTISKFEGTGIVHIVKSSETLFSISRQYHVKLDDLKKWNNLTENSLSIGQELEIKESSLEKNSNNSKGQKIHIVKQSQTLYSISKKYAVTAAQLREWNDLDTDALDIGQTLIVSSSDENVVSASNSSMLPASDDENKKAIDNSKAKNQAKQTAVIGTTSALTNVSNDSDKDIIEAPSKKITQKGLAEVIEQTSDTKKYLALHRNAPVGTIMQVRNEMNNQSVFVRIVGSISPTGDNSKVILKISKKAYDRLGAVDSRFPVEISYIP